MKDRTKYIGGSDLGGILNIYDYSSPMLVWHRKVSGEKNKVTEAMKWGKALEEGIKKEFKKRNRRLKIRNARFLTHREFPYLAGHPDGYVIERDGTKCILEIKTTDKYCEADWKEGIPPQCYAQVQWYMGLANLQKAYVYCLCGGNTPYKYEIPRCDAYIEHAIQKAVGFWNGYVLTKIRPFTTGKDCDKRLLGQRIESSKKEDVYRTNYIDRKVEDLERLKKEVKEKKKEADLAHCKVLEVMEDHRNVESHQFKLEFKNIDRISVDTHALKEKYPDVFEKVRKQGSSSRLSIKEKSK